MPVPFSVGPVRRVQGALRGQWLSIFTVTLVVGAGSAVLAVANAILVRPLPYPDDDRLAQIYLLPPDSRDESSTNPLHPLALVMFRERLTLADGPVGVWARERSIGGEGDPESVATAQVSADFFEVLGVRPILGRTFRPDEDRDGAPVVVLGHALWQRRFGEDPGAIGRSLAIDGRPHQIVGVMPDGFHPGFAPSLLWTPLGVHRGALGRATATYITNVVRMRPGVTLERLDAEVGALDAEIGEASLPVFRRWRAHVWSLREAQYGAQRGSTVTLLVAVAALALMAIANLTHLALTRALGRRVETAVRLALGARPIDLIRSETAAAILVALTAGSLGLLLSQWVLPVLVALDPSRSLPRDAAALDWRVTAGTLLLALLVTLTASIWPVASEARRDARAALVDGGSRGSRPASSLLRLALIGTEMALACVLLSTSLVLLSAFRENARLDPGFDPEGLLAAQLRLVDQRYGSIDARSQLLTDVLDAVRAAPGIASAATTMNEFIPGFSYLTMAAPGDPPPPDATSSTIQFRRISDRYFQTMGIPILAGRGVLPSDTRPSMPVAVVSQLLAERFWPGLDAVGARLQRRTAGTPVLTVVGVVADVSDVRLGTPPQPTIYIPYRQDSNTGTPMTLVVRTSGSTVDAVETVRQAVLRVDAAQPLSGVTTLGQFLDDSLGPERLRSTLLGAFALLGLVLGGAGIYGVTARTVAERTREAGIRLALGGTPVRVWWTMMARVLGAVGVGVAAGLALGRATHRLLTAVLPDLAETTTTGAIWTTLGILAVVGAAAAMLPARRAATLHPITALRSDASGR